MLPLHAVLLVLAANPWAIVAFQVTEGLTAAVIGIMTPLVICDVTRGSGRFNLAQGVAGTAQGIGSAVSTACSGWIVQAWGYELGFTTLAAIGAAGLAVIYFFVPETMPAEFHPRAKKKRR